MSSFIHRLVNGGPEREMDLLTDSISAISSRGQQQSLLKTTNTSSGHAGPSDEMTDNKPAHLTGLEDLNNELELKKTELSQLASDYDHVLPINHTMLKDNQDLAARISQLENDLGATLQQNNSIKHELQACKDDLFRMQPSTEIPDSVVAKAYDELQVHISSWLEGEISSFEINYRKRHQGALPNLFDHQNQSRVKHIMTDYPTAGGEYIVRCYIQIMLHKEILADSVLLLGLDERETTLLQGIEQSMSNAKPPREPGSIQSWRSDTLTALARTKHFQQKRLTYAIRLVHTMFDAVAGYFPVLKKTKGSLQGFYDRVISPAMDLATMIQTSPTHYEFSPSIGTISSFLTRNLAYHQVSAARLIDIGTGKTLKADSPLQEDERGDIGKEVLLLAPALYRHKQGQTPILLVKEVVLVKLHGPLGRRRAATFHQAAQGG
ncbi:MAG: hypothetical protein Q9192_008385 [Flavoplaca navasiana]